MRNLKIFLLPLILLVCSNSYSQPNSIDTPVTLSAKTLRKVMIAAEEAKVLKEQKNLLEERISVLHELVKVQGEKEAALKVMYEGQLSNLLEQKAIYEDQLKSYERLLRKEKRKRFWTGAIGMTTTAAALYLSLK